MPRPIPYLFCRYMLEIGDESLNEDAQFVSLSELQGQYFAHGPTAQRERRFDSVVMRPRRFEVDGDIILSWSIGQKINQRVAAEYDEEQDQLYLIGQDDSSLRYADFVAVPRLGVLAVDDRSGDYRLGGKSAIRRFQSVYRNLEDGRADIELNTLKEDVDRALENWELTEFTFVARPYNPHPPGDLSEALSEQFKADGIGLYRASAKPAEGRRMQPKDDGHIAAARELADAGYGQYSVAGYTGDGHRAKIKQPRFEEEVQKNMKRQEEPRELRVYIELEEELDERLFYLVGQVLINFYGR